MAKPHPKTRCGTRSTAAVVDRDQVLAELAAMGSTCEPKPAGWFSAVELGALWCVSYRVATQRASDLTKAGRLERREYRPIGCRRAYCYRPASR